MNATELAKMLEGWPEGARPSHFPEWKLAWMKLDKSDDPHFIRFGNRYDTQEAEESACMSGLRWLMKQKSGSLLVDPKREYHVSCEPETLFRVVLSDRGGPCVSLAFPHDDYYVNELETEHTGPTLLHAIDAAIKATKGNQ